MQRNDFVTQQMVPSSYSFNPKLCSMCFTHLETGQRSDWALPLAWGGWIIIYAAHAVVVSFLCAPLILILGVGLAALRVEGVSLYLTLLGATLLTWAIGLWVAEKSRRRGELLHKKSDSIRW